MTTSRDGTSATNAEPIPASTSLANGRDAHTEDWLVPTRRLEGDTSTKVRSTALSAVTAKADAPPHTSHASEPSAVAFAALRAAHDSFDGFASEAIEALRRADRTDVGPIVSALQAAVTTHLDGEERDIIPAYAAYDPRDAEALMASHRAIRRTLAELDVTADLHLIRVDAIRELMRQLRAHADHENNGLYAWVETRTARAT